ncbi:single-stranded DNA-binding protein [Ligaoa zhengdingensis]|uniref:single-stranded DNA-binding protein n=1 Tax=Ligaoa zhengdingensis TaxID=2763658 RepID=UPI0031BADBC8
MNKVILLGRLTADPELRQTPNNISVTSFTVAVNRPFTKGAERQADFIDCVAWRNSAEFVSRYFTKGKPILVEGRLQVRSYEDKQGNKRRAYEVVCDNVSFVEGTRPDGPSGTYAAPAAPAAPAPAADTGVAYSNGDVGDFQEVDGYDDLPF